MTRSYQPWAYVCTRPECGKRRTEHTIVSISPDEFGRRCPDGTVQRFEDFAPLTRTEYHEHRRKEAAK